MRLFGVSVLQCTVLCSEAEECCTLNFYRDKKECVHYSICCPGIVSLEGVEFFQKNAIKYPGSNLRDCSEILSNACSFAYKFDTGCFEGDYNCRSYLQCDMDTDGGGWTVLQRRYEGRQNFYGKWIHYKMGFGSVLEEHWVGNDVIHYIVSNPQKKFKVRFDLEDFAGEKAYAEYSEFYVDSEDTNFRLTLGNYSGTAGNAMEDFNYLSIDGMQFSAPDTDNDASDHHCAEDIKKAGFWFRDCIRGNINGLYGQEGDHGVNWRPWRGLDPLKKTEMKIKPVS